MPTILVFHPPSFHSYQMNANFNLSSIFFFPLTHDLILQLSLIGKSTIYKLELIDTWGCTVFGAYKVPNSQCCSIGLLLLLEDGDLLRVEGAMILSNRGHCCNFHGCTVIPDQVKNLTLISNFNITIGILNDSWLMKCYENLHEPCLGSLWAPKCSWHELHWYFG